MAPFPQPGDLLKVDPVLGQTLDDAEEALTDLHSEVYAYHHAALDAAAATLGVLAGVTDQYINRVLGTSKAGLTRLQNAAAEVPAGTGTTGVACGPQDGSDKLAGLTGAYVAGTPCDKVYPAKSGEGNYSSSDIIALTQHCYACYDILTAGRQVLGGGNPLEVCPNGGFYLVNPYTNQSVLVCLNAADQGTPPVCRCAHLRGTDTGGGGGGGNGTVSGDGTNPECCPPVDLSTCKPDKPKPSDPVPGACPATNSDGSAVLCAKPCDDAKIQFRSEVPYSPWKDDETPVFSPCGVYQFWEQVSDVVVTKDAIAVANGDKQLSDFNPDGESGQWVEDELSVGSETLFDQLDLLTR